MQGLQRFLIIGLTVMMLESTGCAQVVVHHPEPMNEPLPNPFKGYTPYADTFYSNPAIPQNLVYDDVTWKNLEPHAAGSIEWDALEDDWEQHVQLGRRIGFRFKCADPWTDDPTDIPDWLVAMGVPVHPYAIDGGTGNLPDWDNPVFLDQHDRIIAALGQRYNNDPRIAWIDVGSYGIWGEWHLYMNDDLAACEYAKQRILDAYIDAFPDKRLVIPFDDDFAMAYMAERGHGLRNDCLGTPAANDWFDESMDALGLQMDQLSATGMIGGEFCGSEQGAREGFGQRFDQNLDFIVRNHWSFIGPAGGSLLVSSGKLLENAKTAYMNMGYRLRIDEIRYNNPASNLLHLAMIIENEGVAPFYYPWQAQIAFSSNGTIMAESAVVDDGWNPRNWMPGETALVAKIPTPHVPGRYDILFSIHDPDTGQPAVLLANTGNDGSKRYLLGQVEVMAGPHAAGDFDQDGDVDASDLVELAVSFNTATGDSDFNPAADMDANYRVNDADLSAWVKCFGH
ncbi:MAG: hypothetical protein CSA23_05185 [Deltaproteobacteria bacterium]|nr:MAG: hypothetical protein CSA23_05185 [Deltaproteobacteria bacterium]